MARDLLLIVCGRAIDVAFGKAIEMNRMLVSAIVALACVAGGVPVQADPPPWAPAHGYRAKQYTYVYYPVREIYYAPETRMWFWMGGNGWQFGANLPVEYRPYTRSGGISVVLETGRPYVQHEYVVARYGKPKKHKRHEHDD